MSMAAWITAAVHMAGYGMVPIRCSCVYFTPFVLGATKEKLGLVLVELEEDLKLSFRGCIGSNHLSAKAPSPTYQR